MNKENRDESNKNKSRISKIYKFDSNSKKARKKARAEWDREEFERRTEDSKLKKKRTYKTTTKS